MLSLNMMEMIIQLLKTLQLTPKPGQKVAIVGPTGAGKTTMVNLLMKFYDINSGDIKIDGVSTKELTRENIHELFYHGSSRHLVIREPLKKTLSIIENTFLMKKYKKCVKKLV